MAKSKNAKPVKIKTYLEGKDNLIKTLRSIGISANDILDKAAIAGAEIVLQEAKKIVRVSEDGTKYGKHKHAAGNLRDNIKIRKPRANDKKAKKRSTASIYVDMKKAYYAMFVEAGTSKMSAKPYLRPAIDNNKKAIGEEITDAVSKAIGRVM